MCVHIFSVPQLKNKMVRFLRRREVGSRELWMMMMMMWTVSVTADSLGMLWVAFVSTRPRSR